MGLNWNGVYVDNLGNDDLLNLVDGQRHVYGLDGGDTYDPINKSIGRLMDGGSGNDRLLGSNVPDSLYGGDDHDAIAGRGGRDFIYGGNGNDQLWGDSGENKNDGIEDEIYGGQGNDGIRGEGGNDVLDGGGGDDMIWGGDEDNGNGTGGDTIYGGNGNDQLFGQDGNDILTGGLGADRYVFSTALNAATNVDLITDFKRGSDKIALSKTIFIALGDSLQKSEFRLGKKAEDKSDHLIYNAKTGKGFFDSDGKGGDNQVLFFQVEKGLKLSVGDFIVI